MTSHATRLRTLAALGPANGLRVLSYRLALKLGVHPVQRIEAAIPDGVFFDTPAEDLPAAPAPAPLQWRTEATLFGAHRVAIGTAPPAWTVDPLTDNSAADAPLQPLTPWWSIDDFGSGDIKRIWELSRFDWAMAFAQQVRAGDTQARDRLNAWITDWVANNPPYRGPNWKCAQEASIRVMHLSVTAMLMGTDTLTGPLYTLLLAHVDRITPTLSYARAQDNNHATSEAAALFIAGVWLGLAGKPGAASLERRGRSLLETHVARLFERDGSFSQYSLNYHRVALDTLSIAEIWRRRAALPPFSALFQQRAAAGAQWLRVMVDPASGDAPNLGANDGANLLALTDAPYRDFRPAVQLASTLFCGGRAYPAGRWDEALAWLGVLPIDPLAPLPALAIFDDGGYAVLRQGTAMALLRYPRFHFRPSQADALHVDLWRDGRNLLRDGGSFSYNTDARLIDYFGGVASHNSIQFDDQPQMPRLSRFLLGDWLTTQSSGPVDDAEGPAFHASYRHRKGWSHARRITLATDSLRVTDRIAGFARQAVLRWRLAPGPWVIEGETVTDGRDRLTIAADVPIAGIALVDGLESRHYLEKTELPVLEVTLTSPGMIVSEYRWAS